RPDDDQRLLIVHVPDADNVSGLIDLRAFVAGIVPNPQQGFHIFITVHLPGGDKHKVIWVQLCPPETTTTTVGTTTTTAGGTTTTCASASSNPPSGPAPGPNIYRNGAWWRSPSRRCTSSRSDPSSPTPRFHTLAGSRPSTGRLPSLARSTRFSYSPMSTPSASTDSTARSASVSTCSRSCKRRPQSPRRAPNGGA